MQAVMVRYKATYGMTCRDRPEKIGMTVIAHCTIPPWDLAECGTNSYAAYIITKIEDEQVGEFLFILRRVDILSVYEPR